MKTREKSPVHKIIAYLDTTGETTRIALLENSGTLLMEDLWPGRFNQSEELLQHLDRLLSRVHLTKTDIFAIAVHRGPGSYTGLRFGITTANFLAYSLNRPVFGIPDPPQLDETDFSKLSCFVSPVQPIYLRPPHITHPRSAKKHLR